MKNLLRKCALPFARLYWRIFRPRTFGVKALVVRADNVKSVLLVQHAYGDQTLWNLPGGGFNPRNETVEEALRRELQEELQCTPEPVEIIGDYYTESEGKRDTVTLCLAQVHGDVHVPPDGEIKKIQWLGIEQVDSLPNVARVAREGIRLYKNKLSHQ